ncbi:hypothetical protein TEA_029007 [Camellia sinensis var. sinensis]|uniref:Uncharacterized protein n=1 Tax=Camellia sinensis var. sinensis TaxID=542762 RepID=A0A4S4EH12_CAMSN|nr:hypothetical protein TEA_029007 [Camellia sinensis var. sinensis]
MSPYEDRYVDMKFVDKIAGYVTVTVDKEFQRWHLFCLAFGFVLLLLAPVVSSWVPFYYSSSMAVGVFLVIIILLFQLWSSVMSPYEDRYVDMKFVDKIAGYVTVTVDKEFQRWHLFCLAFGFVLLLLAPVVSSWVPFYYSSSMAVGVFLVIIILLFQTSNSTGLAISVWPGNLTCKMRFDLRLVLRLQFVAELDTFGYVVGTVWVRRGYKLGAAALGYWMVQKLVIAEDGSVDVGIAQFVKWAMRVIAATFIFQVAIVFITLDTPLAMGALASCLSICFLITFFKWSGPDSTITFGNSIYSANGNPWRGRGRANSSYDLLFILRGLVLTMILYDISNHWEGDEKSTRLLFNIP